MSIRWNALSRSSSALGLALCLTLLVVACGSTVDPGGSGRALGQGEARNISADPGAEPDVMALHDNRRGSDPDQAPVPTRGDGTAPEPGASDFAETPAELGHDEGGGVVVSQSGNRDPIEIGFLNTYVSNFETLGINVGRTYSTQQEYDAVVAAFNEQGGLAGRPIKPVYADTDVGSTNWNLDYQAACEKFTKDHRVAAVLGYSFALSDGFAECLTRAGVVHINTSWNVSDRTTFERSPYLVSPNLTADRRYLLRLEGAVRSGMLTHENRLGLIVSDCPFDQRAYQRTALPYIERQGLTVASTYTLSCPSGAGDVGPVAQQIQSAVLRFRTSGVDTVVTVQDVVLFFSHNAETQGYRPDYLIDIGGSQLEANAPQQQLQNLYGFGWLPSNDVSQGQRPPPNVPQRRCLALFESKGLTPKEPGDEFGFYSSCDALFLYETALKATGGGSAAAQITGVIESLDSSFESALTTQGRTSFSQGLRDGAALYHPYAWDHDCRCFAHRGQPAPISNR